MKRFLRILFGRTPAPPLDAGQPVAWSSMASLLEDLEKIGDEHPEIYDTDVRERMWTVVERVLIKGETGFVIPADLGMFSDEANQRLRAVLDENLRRLETTFRTFELDTEAKRLNSFCNPRLKTERGQHVDAFFGHP